MKKRNLLAALLVSTGLYSATNANIFTTSLTESKIDTMLKCLENKNISPAKYAVAMTSQPQNIGTKHRPGTPPGTNNIG